MIFIIIMLLIQHVTKQEMNSSELNFMLRCRAQLKPDGTRWRTLEEMKGGHASGVGSQ